MIPLSSHFDFSSPPPCVIGEGVTSTGVGCLVLGDLDFGRNLKASARNLREQAARFFQSRDHLQLSTQILTMVLSSRFCTVGRLSIYFAQEAMLLYIGRLATGYGMRVFSYVVMILTGVSISFILGTVLTWRVLALTGIIPCAILLFGIFIISEFSRRACS